MKQPKVQSALKSKRDSHRVRHKINDESLELTGSIGEPEVEDSSKNQIRGILRMFKGDESKKIVIKNFENSEDKSPTSFFGKRSSASR